MLECSIIEHSLKAGVAQVSESGLSSACRPPLDDARLDFVADARRFSAARRNLLGFRLLKWMLRCSEDELDQLLAKIYCESLVPECSSPESLGRSALKALAQPFFFLLRKKWLWRREPPVLFTFEAADPAHLEAFYVRIWSALPAPKRVAPSAAPRVFPDSPPTDPLNATVAPQTVLRLLATPLWLPGVWLLSRRLGRNLIAPFRRALGTYALYDGHFRRYPSRHFVTCEDSVNHPSRYLAFKQNSSGKLAAIQNGCRLYYPPYAFGAVDAYFSFGRYLQRLCPELGIKASAIHPVGCLPLDRRRGLYEELLREAKEPDIDVLLLDQGLWPFNGQDRGSKEGYEKLFQNLNELKRRHPRYRVAIQLRGYAARPEHGRLVARTHARFFSEPVEIIDNDGLGQSYRSVFRARLVITYNSTMGLEAFFFGANKKTLFVNYAGVPYFFCSPDPLYQLYDDAADYAALERRVEELLALRLDEPPAVARDQNEFFDGRVQERIAQILAGPEFGA